MADPVQRHDSHDDDLQILLIGGDARVRRMVTRALPEASGELYVSALGLQAEALTASRAFDLILLDLVLPDTDGRALLTRLRQAPQTADTPIFVLSVAQSPHLKAECLALGADAFFTKPLRRSVLRDAVQTVLQTSAEDRALDLPVRPTLRAAFEQTRKQADASDASLHFISLRIDGFDDGVEQHGEDLEHQLIDRIGHDLEDALGPSGLWVRWARDEFAALSMPEATDDLPAALAQLQKQVKAKRFQVDDGDPVRVTLTVVAVEVFGSVSLDEVVARAARLMAEASLEQGPGAYLADTEGLELPRRSALFVMGKDILPGSIRRRLEREGFDVILAPDHLAALTAGVSQKSFDVALVDANIRDEDGKPTLPILARLSSLRTTPFLLLIDRGKEEQLVHGFEHGVKDYLTRPFPVTDLLNRLHFVLKTYPLGEPDSTPTKTEVPTAPLPVLPSVEEPDTEDAWESFKLPSDPLLDALAQTVRTRLVEGEPVSIPELGNLKVISVTSRLVTTEEGRVIVEPPRNKITFTPTDPTPPSAKDPAP